MNTNPEYLILQFLKDHTQCTSKQVHELLSDLMSYSTTKRLLSKMVKDNMLISIGQGKGTKYLKSPAFQLLQPIDIKEYFEKEIDEREINTSFNLDIISIILQQSRIFSTSESNKLSDLHSKYKENILQLTRNEYLKELERLAIDLSWKSSQIEGNNYSLLETERLLKDKETALGNTKDEATMLLNHKEAIDFIVEHPDYLTPLSISKIEDIHSILITDLAIERSLRKRRVGISGTNYRPLENEF